MGALPYWALLNPKIHPPFGALFTLFISNSLKVQVPFGNADPVLTPHLLCGLPDSVVHTEEQTIVCKSCSESLTPKIALTAVNLLSGHILRCALNARHRSGGKSLQLYVFVRPVYRCVWLCVVCLKSPAL